MAPSSESLLHVKCLLCGEHVQYTRGATQPLLEHLDKEHPAVRVFFLPGVSCDAHSEVKGQQSPALMPSSDRTVTTVQRLELGERPKWTAKQRGRGQSKKIPPNSSPRAQNPSGVGANGASDQTQNWRPGSSISCLSCKKRSIPIVRYKKVKTSCLNQDCCMGCCPLFLLRCFAGNDAPMDLYCSACKSYLGVYDQQSGLVSKVTEQNFCGLTYDYGG